MESQSTLAQKIDYIRRLLVARFLIQRMRLSKFARQLAARRGEKSVGSLLQRRGFTIAAMAIALLGTALFTYLFTNFREPEQSAQIDLPASLAGVIERNSTPGTDPSEGQLLSTKQNQKDNVTSDESLTRLSNSDESAEEDTASTAPIGELVRQTSAEEYGSAGENDTSGEFGSPIDIEMSGEDDSSDTEEVAGVTKGGTIDETGLPVGLEAEVEYENPGQNDTVGVESDTATANGESPGVVKLDAYNLQTVAELESLRLTVARLTQEIVQLKQETLELEAELLRQQTSFSQSEQQWKEEAKRLSDSPERRVVYNITNIPVGGYVTEERIEEDRKVTNSGSLMPGDDLPYQENALFQGNTQGDMSYQGVAYDQSDMSYQEIQYDQNGMPYEDGNLDPDEIPYQEMQYDQNGMPYPDALFQQNNQFDEEGLPYPSDPFDENGMPYQEEQFDQNGVPYQNRELGEDPYLHQYGVTENGEMPYDPNMDPNGPAGMGQNEGIIQGNPSMMFGQ